MTIVIANSQTSGEPGLSSGHRIPPNNFGIFIIELGFVDSFIHLIYLRVNSNLFPLNAWLEFRGPN
jgi:hypothetical protein